MKHKPVKVLAVAAGIVGGLFVALIVLGGVLEAVGYQPTANTEPTPKAAPVPTPLPTPAAAKPSVAPQPTSTAASKPAPTTVAPDRAGAAAILAANVAHYRSVFQKGQDIVGTTQYPDAMTGLEAMDDPTSAAARFRDYRQNPGPERDLSSQDAFSQADSYFNADNEPQAISDWRDDMGTMQSDLSQWVQVAVDYQISQRSQADLNAAAATVEQDLAKADADVHAVAGN